MADLTQSQVMPGHEGETRRDFLILTAAAIGGVGAAVSAWPLIDSLTPARSTAPPGASARGRRRSTWSFRLPNSPPTPLSRSARKRHGRPIPSRAFGRPAQPHPALDRLPPPVLGGSAARFHGVSGPAQPELLVEFRLSGRSDPGHHDRHRRGAGDALPTQRRSRFRFGRADYARRQLRLAVALHPRQRRVDVLSDRLHPPVPRPLLRLPPKTPPTRAGC